MNRPFRDGKDRGYRMVGGPSQKDQFDSISKVPPALASRFMPELLSRSEGAKEAYDWPTRHRVTSAETPASPPPLFSRAGFKRTGAGIELNCIDLCLKMAISLVMPAPHCLSIARLPLPILFLVGWRPLLLEAVGVGFSLWAHCPLLDRVVKLES